MYACVLKSCDYRIFLMIVLMLPPHAIVMVVVEVVMAQVEIMTEAPTPATGSDSLAIEVLLYHQWS